MVIMSTVSGNKTLFVRNLPYSVTKDKLEEHFSEYGPLKNCFIVFDRASGKSRGFGYVQFTVREDAIKAKESKNVLDGRSLAVDYADIKRKKKSEKRKKKDGDEDSNEGGEEDLDKELAEDIKTIKQEKDSNLGDNKKDKVSLLKYHKAKIVLLSGLPSNVTEGELNTCLQKLNVKSVAETKIIKNGKVHVKFKCIRDAKKAIRKLNNQAYKDGLLQACQLSQDMESLPQSVFKRSRIIVRNLAFKCTEADLQKSFQNCGTITEVKLPTNSDGKSLGFGFVQFTRVQEAQNAIKTMNLQKIAGRPVAVDWALPKDRYESKQQKDVQEIDDSEGSEEDEKVKIKEEPKSDDDEEEEEESDNSGSEEEDDVASSEESDSGIIKDEDDDDDDDEEEEDNEEEEDEDNSDSDVDSDEDTLKKKKTLKKKAPMNSDVDNGCTIFIRNLSFDSNEEGLQDFFGKYGELSYARVVIDHNTEHSRGMAFVKFKKKDAADACLAESSSQSMTLDGRDLIISLAVSREQSSQFNEKKEKVKKDNRNLHLAREGLIRPGTAAAEGLSKADLDKRAKVEEVKRQKLKNINIFISPLRLCVRNIPTHVDEKELKKIFKDAAGQSAAKVDECRIMRDRTRLNSAGVGKSQGFGFVSFSEHQHALTALRHINNNPDIFGKDKRLIVEFSLENRKALETQARRKERFLSKREQQKNQSGGSQANSDQSGQRPVGKRGKKANQQNPMIYMSEQDRKLKGDKLGPKGLPSHWGPKIRHKPRPSQVAKGSRKGQKATTNPGRQNQPVKQPQKRTMEHTEGPVRKKSRRGNRNESDSFDKLVSNYRNKFIQKRPDQKWFTS